MAQDLRKVNDIESLMTYFSEKLGWAIAPDDYYDIDDITYDFEAADLGLKEEAFAKITSLKQLRPLVDDQRWGIFFVNFESNRFEVSALRKILSGLVPARRNVDHAVWDKKDLLFLCTWGERNKVTIGAAHFEDAEKGLPQIKMISCEPAVEDFTQINIFEQRLAKLAWPRNPSDTVAWHDAWASAFTTRYRQTIQDSHTLTIRLAEEAQNIRDRILSTLEIETSNGYVHLLFQKFRDTLVHDMTEQQFADMYAQTVVYGLFSARCMDESQEDFNAAEAVECIPNTNPFLKGLLQECLGSNNAKSKLSFDELEVGNIVDLLLHTKTDSIITDFNRQTGGGREDPVIHSNKGIPIECPLYLYSQGFDGRLTRYPNLNNSIVTKLASSIGLRFVPEKSSDVDTICPVDILDYIYAVLFSKKYRKAYLDFLKFDFPRIPFPQSADYFWAMVFYGSKLRELHLSEDDRFDAQYSYQGCEECIVDRPTYRDETVYFNKSGDRILNVPESIWNMYFGGYQPLQKWLKDRKGDVLNSNDIRHFQSIISTLVTTDEIMQQIDEVIIF